MKTAFAMAASLLALSACATDPNSGQMIYGNTARGAAIGALGGAAVGVLAGGDDGRNAAIGAAVGAIAGGGVGVYMDKQEAELRRQTAGTDIGVIRNGNQIELRMPADVTFAVNQANIQSQFYPALNDVATTLVGYPSTSIDIVGHADADGADAYNQDLSERRANSVKNYLVGRGVQSVRILATGRGESQPVASNTTVSGKAQNRRVQVVLTPVT
ncbi:MAG: OmpA family protein [Alphaproteobacteria bacterium]|nr:OmpA family protein [Alphaproteobacteria bacterium]